MHIYYESLWRNCIHLNPLYASIFDIYSNDRSRECLELKKKQIYIYIALKYLRNGRKLNAYDNKRILKGDAKRNYYESN